MEHTSTNDPAAAKSNAAPDTKMLNLRPWWRLRLGLVLVALFACVMYIGMNTFGGGGVVPPPPNPVAIEAAWTDLISDRLEANRTTDDLPGLPSSQNAQYGLLTARTSR